MSDESPRDERPANDAPADEPTAPGEPAAPAEAEGPAAPPPPPGEPPARRGVFVPRWVTFVAGAVVAVLVLFFGGFALGHYTAPSGGNEGRERTEREAPGREGRGRGGNEGPSAPGRISGVFLGVATRDATGDVKGAEILQVLPGGPAAQAGLQNGDVVTAVDGSSVTSASDLRQQVRNHQSGDHVTITYTRGGNSAQTQVTLGNRSSAATPSA